MANSLYPAFGVVDYASIYGSHKMTIPTLEWNIGIGTHGHGGYVAHDGTTSVDAQDMWTDLVTDIAAFATTTMTFNEVTLYTKSAPDAPAVPVTIISLAIAGLAASAAPEKASQQTWNCRTVLIGKFKLVLLDAPVPAGFAKVAAASFGAPDLAIIGALSDLTKAWAGRDGSAIANGISKTFTLNDKLRREYGMS